MNWNAKWITADYDFGEICPTFFKTFSLKKNIRKATLFITATGTYEATINQKRVGNFMLAPGFTSYAARLQYQEYDVTALLSETNQIQVTVGKGWYHSPMPGWGISETQKPIKASPLGLITELFITYADDSTDHISSDESWAMQESQTRFSEIYDGEIFDATADTSNTYPVKCFLGPTHTLIPQQGPEIHEQEILYPSRILTTPAGDTVLDFGQEISGYVEIHLSAHAGEKVELICAEILDKAGNFYNENYRGAKSQYLYICKEGEQTYKPRFTFYGFRYLKISAFPGGPAAAKIENFKGIAVYSDMKRTGYLSCSNPLLNQLFSNVIWGQKGNFIDVPTDCPQRDERLGWTGDAQVFCRTACLNFDVKKFFAKWLADMAADQFENGGIADVIPDVLNTGKCSAAWGDAAVICPWEVYLAYGDKSILVQQYDCMKKWISYISTHSNDEFLWTGGEHYGDWLGLDSPVGTYKGSTREDFIASAFYAYSTSLMIKAGNVLNEDTHDYELLYQNIVAAFRKTYPEYFTQTECVLALYFHLAIDPKATAAQLVSLIQSAGMHLQTGFVGTPYLLHALSSNGYTELAYTLLLRKEYPSWLYPVTKGATTIWEHWDGIMENGDVWSKDMNSFNHYAYGSVTDWVYTVAAGIQTVEQSPGYERVLIAPHPDERLDWLSATLDTKYGQIVSKWSKEDGSWRYEITMPMPGTIVIDCNEKKLEAGTYLFWTERTQKE